MTTSTLTQLPLMAGTALLGTLGRTGQWALGRYMRTPLASTGLLAMVTLTALAGSNALYFQTRHHPSPFFVSESVASVEEQAPVPVPARERPTSDSIVLTVPTQTAPETTGSVQSAPATIPDAPVGNAEVFEVQKKLAELKLFDGKVDGYYGPMTARAIRAFEERNGLTPMGALDPGVVQAILNADSAGRTTTPVRQPQAAATPAPAPQPVAVQQASLAPQSAPAPAAAPVQQDQVVARLPALSPAEQTFDQVAQSAANTIDSIIAGIDGARSTPAQVSNPPIPKATVAAQPMAQATQSMPALVPAEKAEPVQAPVQIADISPNAGAPAAPPATDAELVSQIQRGLASLGFFHAPIDGKPGAETARAIREFENFYRFKITGQVQPDLVGLLRDAGASI